MQIIDDFGGDNIGRRQAVRVGQAFVLNPEQIQAQLIVLQKLVIIEAAPAALGIGRVPCFGTLVHAARLIAGNELVEVATPDRLLFQR